MEKVVLYCIACEIPIQTQNAYPIMCCCHRDASVKVLCVNQYRMKSFI